MVYGINGYDQYVPEELVKEIDEYEKKYRKQQSKPRGRGVFPSNEDIVNAILKVTGGRITRYNIDNLYDSVVEYLSNQGFDVSVLTPSRVERLVESLVRKGVISKVF